MKIYLCGPINGCTDDEAKTWREWFIEKHPDCIDPMVRDYRGKEHECGKEIVQLDKIDIRSCDALVCMFVKPSVGTSMEVFYANAVLGMPVVTIDESGRPLPPWLVEHSTAIVASKEEALEKIRSWNAEPAVT